MERQCGNEAFDALNLVYNEPERRSFIWLNIISLTFTVLGILFVLVAIGAMVVVPLVLSFIGLAGATEMIIKVARWPLLLIGVTLALAVLYRYGPSREKPQHRHRCIVAHCFYTIFLVRGEFRELQRDLRYSRRNYRVYALDLAVDDLGVDRRRAKRRKRAPNRPRYGHRADQSPWGAGRQNGRYSELRRIYLVAWPRDPAAM